MEWLFSLVKGLPGARDSGFNSSEMKRLTEMKKHQVERGSQLHNDFLSKVGETESDHIHRMEHHGTEFWARYREGESPRGVIQDEPTGEHQYGTFQDQQSVEAHQLRPEFASCMIPTRERPRLERLNSIASQRDWLDHIRIAEAALEQKGFSEAEVNFLVALNASKLWSADDLRVTRTLAGLANSLVLQGKHEEVEALNFSAPSVEGKAVNLMSNPSNLPISNTCVHSDYLINHRFPGPPF
jgi:hypothetical protein